MNTIRSTYIGWGALIIAGGGSYFFAKRSIDADKRRKFDALRKKQLENIEAEEREIVRQTRAKQQSSSHSQAHYQGQDSAGNPSVEASADPAPTDRRENAVPRSKYEPKTSYRSPRGDRFS